MVTEKQIQKITRGRLIVMSIYDLSDKAKEQLDNISPMC